jgi:hypothetical protein
MGKRMGRSIMGKRMGNASNVWTPIRSAADLPRQSGEYLVTMCDGPLGAPIARYMRIVNYDVSDETWREKRTEAWFPAKFAWDGAGWTRVTAWRPMPKPYEGGA